MPTDKEIEAAADAVFELMPQPLKLSNMVVSVLLAKTLAKAALKAAEQARWQPIETLKPYDHVLMYSFDTSYGRSGQPEYNLGSIDSHKEVAFRGVSAQNSTVTHWQPLPSTEGL